LDFASYTKILYSLKLHAAPSFPKKMFFLIFGNSTVILGPS
jgi:hypothetical protein